MLTPATRAYVILLSRGLTTAVVYSAARPPSSCRLPPRYSNAGLSVAASNSGRNMGDLPEYGGYRSFDIASLESAISIFLSISFKMETSIHLDTDLDSNKRNDNLSSPLVRYGRRCTRYACVHDCVWKHTSAQTTLHTSARRYLSYIWR